MRRLYHWIATKPYHVMTSVFGLCVIIYLVAIPLPRKIPGLLFSSDGIGYFMYTRSLVIDHDLDFRDEYARLRPNAQPAITPTGLVTNQYAIGVGLLWIPFFIVAHILALLLKDFGLPVATDGYSYLYQSAICLGSMTYGFVAMILIYRLVARYYMRVALATTILIWLATNIVYYMVGEPSMSHMASLFAVALFLYLWLKWRPISMERHWVLLGFAGGLVAIVRQPDATYLILPLLDSLLAYNTFPSWRKSKLIGGICYVGGFALIFSIQMVTWKLLYGNLLLSGYFYGGTQGFSWFSPRVFDMLFSLWRGIYPLHPITIFATVGLAWFYRADKWLAVFLGLGFIVQIYIISAWGTQGDSFGGRMFISSLPGLALGLAAFIEWIVVRSAAVALWSIGIVLVIWNGLFMIQYRFGYIPTGDTRYTLEQLTFGKIEMLHDLAYRIIRFVSR
jgi:hypothetical protein